jgi:hypothetical protein
MDVRLVLIAALALLSVRAQTPPNHTDHDTLDKISAAGIGNAVCFHMRLLECLQML